MAHRQQQQQQYEDTIASEVLSASLGGAISASILYPLEVLKTKMQADGDNKDDDKKKGMLKYAQEMYEKQGYQVFLHGIETSALQSAMEKAFYFFAYTALKQGYEFLTSSPQHKKQPMGTMTNLLLGCLAEWAHLPITMPIDCLTTAIQTSTKGENAMALLLTILKEGNMYKGIQAYYILCLKPALQYTVFEQVKAAVLKSRKTKSLSAAEAFLLGMVARTVATVAVFPFVRAKVVMQTRQKQLTQTSAAEDTKNNSNGSQKKVNTTATTKSNFNNNRNNEISVMALLREMYSTGGIYALYQGLGPELTRGVFSAALMLMIKEKVNGGVKHALYGNNNTTNIPPKPQLS